MLTPLQLALGLLSLPLILTLTVGCSRAITENGGGVQFLGTDYEEALATAEAENKAVMIEFYTDWCVYCKELESKVFQDREAADFLNSNFVSLKIDAEKDRGPELKKQFRVQGYPTVLILSPQGKEIDRIVGFGGDKAEFIQTISDYLANKNTLTTLLEKLESDDKDAGLHFKVAGKYRARGDHSLAYSHYREYLRLDPEQPVDQATEARYHLARFDLMEKDSLAPMLDFVDTIEDEKYIGRGFAALIHYFEKRKQPSRVTETYEAAIAQLPDHASLLNNFAWYIFANELSDRYAQGIALAQRAILLKPGDGNIWDTLAQLCYVNGDLEEAVKAMRTAVELSPETAQFKKDLKRFEESS